MTSEKKIESNRRNAQRSTGPKTKSGKDASSKNALKHGLAAAVGIKTRSIEDMKAALSKDCFGSDTAAIARLTELITRADQLRLRAMSEGLHGLKPIGQALQEVTRLSRYHARAFSQLDKILKKMDAEKEAEAVKKR